jgi:hypothetical protein
VSRWLRRESSAPRVLALDWAQLAWMQDDSSGAPTVASWSYRHGSATPLQQAFGDAKPDFVDVIAGNDVAIHWVQEPPASTASFAELRLIAGARCAHLYGGTPADWRIAGGWHPSRPFVCCALPHDVVLSVEQHLAELKLVPRWHSAWSVLSQGMPKAFPSDGWSAVRSPARVVLWHCSGEQVDGMATWPVDARDDTASAARSARRQMQVEMSRSGHAVDEGLHWLDMVADDPLPALSEPGVSALIQDPRIAKVSGAAPSEATAALALRKLAGGRGA